MGKGRGTGKKRGGSQYSVSRQTDEALGLDPGLDARIAQLWQWGGAKPEILDTKTLGSHDGWGLVCTSRFSCRGSYEHVNSLPWQNGMKKLEGTLSTDQVTQ